MLASFKCEHNYLVRKWSFKIIFTDLNIDVAASVSTYSCYIVQLSTTDEKTFNYGMSFFFLILLYKKIFITTWIYMIQYWIIEIQKDHFSRFLWNKVLIFSLYLLFCMYIRQTKVPTQFFATRPNFLYVFTHIMRVIMGQKNCWFIAGLWSWSYWYFTFE